MSGPTCPHCGAAPVAAFFKPRFTCSACGTRLSSNLRMVSLVEWLVGIGPLMLIAAALLKTDALREWSFAQALLLLLVPACVVHWAVLRRYLKLIEQADR
jgi:uncharacterized protein (DUF983 family)